MFRNFQIDEKYLWMYNEDDSIDSPTIQLEVIEDMVFHYKYFKSQKTGAEFIRYKNKYFEYYFPETRPHMPPYQVFVFKHYKITFCLDKIILTTLNRYTPNETEEYIIEWGFVKEGNIINKRTNRRLESIKFRDDDFYIEIKPTLWYDDHRMLFINIDITDQGGEVNIY